MFSTNGEVIVVRGADIVERERIVLLVIRGKLGVALITNIEN